MCRPKCTWVKWDYVNFWLTLVFFFQNVNCNQYSRSESIACVGSHLYGLCLTCILELNYFLLLCIFFLFILFLLITIIRWLLSHIIRDAIATFSDLYFVSCTIVPCELHFWNVYLTGNGSIPTISSVILKLRYLSKSAVLMVQLLINYWKSSS